MDLKGPLGDCKDFGFYSKCNGKTLEAFEQMTDII